MPQAVIIVLFLLGNLVPLNADDHLGVEDDFLLYRVLVPSSKSVNTGGNFSVTSTRAAYGSVAHAIYSYPLQFKNSSNGSVNSFSTTFVFQIIPDDDSGLGGHGMAFFISPSNDLSGALPAQYLGLFNNTNVGKSSNHIVAVELDMTQSPEFKDIDDNHVGIDLNDLTSVRSETAGYHQNGKFRRLRLVSGNPMQVWIDYDGFKKQLDVTLSPIKVPKPIRPLISLTKDLSPILFNTMYVGFSCSTGQLSSSQCILGWSFAMNNRARSLDFSQLTYIRYKRDNNHYKRKIVLVTGLLVVLVPLFVGIIFFLTRKNRFKEVVEHWEVQYGPQRFTYKDLFIATKGFNKTELLGRGGFGRVYRGNLPSSKLQVAVKKVSHDSKQGLREFIAEITTLGRLRHRNLVSLLGYCRRKGELFLVYDYMPNGSLDKFLFSPSNALLDWSQRYKIIKDISSTLLYLHQQWVQVVIHRDIKASNILLDDELNARLGDFGLAKLCDHGADPQTSRAAGTLGYIAPELARIGKASTKTDVFAFGAFLLEMSCGRRPVEPQAPPEEILLVDWVTKCWKKGTILQTVDPRLGNEYVVEEMELVLKLGLLCSHIVPDARPRMSRVVQYLGGDASLPHDFNTNFLALEEHNEGFNDDNDSISHSSTPTITITESFISRGR